VSRARALVRGARGVVSGAKGLARDEYDKKRAYAESNTLEV
jgi:hypothetical protein